MKILVAGQFVYDIYENAFCDAFDKMGHQVAKHQWYQYFKGYPFSDFFERDNNFIKSIYYKLQNKFLAGPAIYKLNRNLITLCEEYRPDLIFIYRGNYLYARTLRKIKKLGCVLYLYNNDDPFGKNWPKYHWRHYFRGVHLYDHVFAYRHKNLVDYENLGIRSCSLLRSYYIKKNNYPVEQASNKLYLIDVIFIGHWEDDGRDEYILEIIKSGVNFKLYGTEWSNSKYYPYIREKLGDIHPLHGEAYNNALSGAKIALVFLSKLNNDTYTRRCFEIPATKTLMLSIYSNDLDSLFKKGVEADYFESKDEMIEKIKYYLSAGDEREKLAGRGHHRLVSDGHEVLDRAKQVIENYERSYA